MVRVKVRSRARAETNFNPTRNSNRDPNPPSQVYLLATTKAYSYDNTLVQEEADSPL